jgi:hypothetical protein
MQSQTHQQDHGGHALQPVPCVAAVMMLFGAQLLEFALAALFVIRLCGCIL